MEAHAVYTKHVSGWVLLDLFPIVPPTQLVVFTRK